MTQAASKFQEELKLNRAVYDASRRSTSPKPIATKYFVSKTCAISGWPASTRTATRNRIASMRATPARFAGFDRITGK